MIQLLELVDRDFKATIISILKNLQEKMNVMQGDMEQQEKEKQRKNQVKTVELKNTIFAEKD